MNVIQCDYDRLEQIAVRFGAEANRVETVQTDLQNRLSPLENGGWVGKGSDAFFAEMHQVVLPVVQRLRAALEEAGDVSQRILVIIKSAEEEASDPFRQPSETAATPPPRIYIINGINSDATSQSTGKSSLATMTV